ncbi:heat shock protein 90-6, mitochondrial [Tanacetum coccineum]
MISSGRRYKSTASDFDTPHVPVEKFEYQAEVSRRMDLIVKSLYSNKEAFLQELIRQVLAKLKGQMHTDNDIIYVVETQGKVSVHQTMVGKRRKTVEDEEGRKEKKKSEIMLVNKLERVNGNKG